MGTSSQIVVQLCVDHCRQGRKLLQWGIGHYSAFSFTSAFPFYIQREAGLLTLYLHLDSNCFNNKKSPRIKICYEIIMLLRLHGTCLIRVIYLVTVQDFCHPLLQIKLSQNVFESLIFSSFLMGCWPLPVNICSALIDRCKSWLLQIGSTNQKFHHDNCPRIPFTLKGVL